MSEFGSARWFEKIIDRLELNDADIYVVGYGHRVPDDLTLEGIGALRRSRHIFALPPLGQKELDLPHMIDLTSFYGPRRLRRDTYVDIVESVISAAREDPPVAFVTFGSPVVGVFPAHLFISAGPAHNLRVRVCSGVSFLEGIWTNLNIDPFDGFLVWNATAFLGLKAEPPTAAHLLLVQVPFINAVTGPPTGGWQPVDLRPLRDHLLKFYDERHQVSFVRVESNELPGQVISLPLRDLATAPIDLSSLLVPRVPATLDRLGRIEDKLIEADKVWSSDGSPRLNRITGLAFGFPDPKDN
jgi:uncharacterized protein YabN with tetrapyrrole methylase and pyrophosphatase domain